jgi:hypothetical protein
MEGGGIEAPEWEEQAAASTSGEGGVIFVLENANLETAKVGKNYELLNCDDHANFLRRHKKDPALYRPDICHQVGAGCWMLACSGVWWFVVCLPLALCYCCAAPTSAASWAEWAECTSACSAG